MIMYQVRGFFFLSSAGSSHNKDVKAKLLEELSSDPDSEFSTSTIKRMLVGVCVDCLIVEYAHYSGYKEEVRV